MANIKGQIKRNKQNEKKRLSNNAFRSALRTAIKTIETSVEAGDKEAAVAALNLSIKKLDKAVVKGLFHKNYINKKKSSLAKLVNTIA